jgi:hypothetical protein
MNEEARRLARDLARERATKCANKIMAMGGRVCGGCGKEYVCPLDQMVQAKFGPSIWDRLLSDPVVRQNVTMVFLAPIGQPSMIVD